MGRSPLYDLGIGTVTGVISTVVVGIVAIVWKCIKPRRNISMGQPENPFAGEQFVIDMTSSGPLTSSPFSSPPTSPFLYDDVTSVNAVQKVLEMFNNDMVEASPLVTLPGYGKSPMVRQLRITDSPFPLKDDGDSRMDKAAEDFVNKFYKKLKLQKRRLQLNHLTITSGIDEMEPPTEISDVEKRILMSVQEYKKKLFVEVAEAVIVGALEVEKNREKIQKLAEKIKETIRKIREIKRD